MLACLQDDDGRRCVSLVVVDRFASFPSSAGANSEIEYISIEQLFFVGVGGMKCTHSTSFMISFSLAVAASLLLYTSLSPSAMMSGTRWILDHVFSRWSSLDRHHTGISDTLSQGGIFCPRIVAHRFSKLPLPILQNPNAHTPKTPAKTIAPPGPRTGKLRRYRICSNPPGGGRSCP